MKKLLFVLLCLPAVARAQDYASLLSSFTQDWSTAFGASSEVWLKDPIIAISKGEAASKLGLSANGDENFLFFTVSFTGSGVPRNHLWDHDLISSTGLRASTRIGHVADGSVDSRLDWSPLDPQTGERMMNPQTGAPWMSNAYVNGGLNLVSIPTANMGLGYKYHNYYIEGMFHRSNPDLLGFSDVETKLQFWHLTIGGSHELSAKNSLTYQLGIQNQHMNMYNPTPEALDTVSPYSNGDLFAADFGDDYALALRPDSVGWQTNLGIISGNVGVQHKLNNWLRAEAGLLFYQGSFSLQEYGAIYLVLAAKDPDAGLPNVVEELPGGFLSTASNTGMGAAPYLTISTYSKWKRALALTFTNSSVSLRWIL